MSEQYIVSARKYRPQTFDTVVGQEHITTTLKNAVRQQHLAHAYLFCGPRGVGKTTCARILARTINCENPTPDTEACGVCATCQSFGNNTSFNVFELDAASNNSVEDIRSLIDQVRFAPQQGKYKIYIIDEVHMLSAAAFNAFLKTLEEPPPYAIFILATTEKHKILPTILSRCQIFDFRRITTQDISAHLLGITQKEGLRAEEAALHVIAQKSEGCMRDALSMLDRISGFTGGLLTYSSTMEHLNLLDADYYFRLTDHMLAQDVGSTLLLLDQALEKGFEGDVILNGLAEHMRNLLLCKDQRMVKLLEVPNDHKPVYFEKANQAPPAFILSALNIINDAELGYKNASNKRLHVELCLIRLCYVLQATRAGSAAEKKKQDELSASPRAAQILSPVQAAPPAAASASVSSTSPPAQATSPATLPASVSPASPPVQAASPSAAPAPVSSTSAAAQGSPPTPAPVPQSASGAVRPAPAQGPAPQPAPAAAQVPPGSSARPASPSAAPMPPASASPSGNGARRISKNLIDDIDEAINSQPQQHQSEVKELTPGLAEALFDEYKKVVREQNKGVLYVQLNMMRAEALPPDEIRIVSPTEMINEYALDNRNDLIDFFSRHVGARIRVTTEVRADAAAVPEQKPVLSKSEIYEAMVQKNPYLGALKDGLNLQIDY